MTTKTRSARNTHTVEVVDPHEAIERAKQGRYGADYEVIHAAEEEWIRPGKREMDDRLTHIRLDHIAGSSLNPRKGFDADALAELAASIKEHGVLQPIVVRPASLNAELTPRGQKPTYEIVAGERRWRASQLAGLVTVPAVIREDLDDTAALQLALIENLQRSDLDPLEEAAGYKDLSERLGMKQKEIGVAVGRSRAAVANRLRLLELPDDVQTLLRSGQLSPAHGIALARWTGFPKVASKVAAMAVAKKWTAHELEKGLPSAYTLKEAKLVAEWSYYKKPDDECQKCDAYVKDSYSHYCLRPKCKEDREKAAKTAEEQTKTGNAAKLEAAKGKALGDVPVEDLPELKFMHYDTYQRIDAAQRAPAGCKGDCPKRARALESNQTVTTICTDPACWKKLKAQQTKEKNAPARARHKDLLSNIELQVDALWSDDSRVALLFAKLATDGNLYADTVKRLIARYDLPDDEYTKAALADYAKAPTKLEAALAILTPVQIHRFAVEVILREELHGYYAQDRTWQGTPITDWFLGTAATPRVSPPVTDYEDENEDEIIPLEDQLADYEAEEGAEGE